MSEHDTRYFQASPLPLEAGSVILPGNWGRIIRGYTNGKVDFANMWILFREQTFEMVRQTQFPDKPSRLESAFLFLEEDKVRQFRINHNRMHDVLYEVKIVDPSKKLHVGDMNLSELENGLQFMDAVEENATKYWEGTGIAYPELITESPIRVCRRID